MTFSSKMVAMTALCMLPASLALAQSQGQDGGNTGNMGEKGPDQVTCADIVAMDTQIVPGALYFIAGHRQGSQSGMMGDQSTAHGSSAGASSSTAADHGATTSSTGAGTSATTDSTTSGTDTTTSGASSDSSSSTTAADSSSTTTSDTSTGTASGASSSDTATSGTNTSSDAGSATANSTSSGMQGNQAQVVRITGLFEIPVEQVMVVCGQSPDMTASDAVEQHRSGSSDGSSSN